MFRMVGSFEVRADMMGLTSEGEVRVWASNNFADNTPQYGRRGLLGMKRMEWGIDEEERVLVVAMVMVVRQICDRTLYQMRIGGRLEKANSFREFREAVKEIKQ